MVVSQTKGRIICSRRGAAAFIWGVSSFLSMLILSYVANHMGYIGRDLPPVNIVIAAPAVLGCPLAVLVSVGSGPRDQLFGVASLMSGLMAILGIPRSTPQKTSALP